MKTIELNDNQVAVLKETLDSMLSDFSVEIAGTDKKDYRDQVKAERDTVRSIRAQLD